MPIKHPVRKKKPRSASKRPAPRPLLDSPLLHPKKVAERREKLLREAREKGINPIEDFDRHLAEVTDFWPENESMDEFLAWLRTSRRDHSNGKRRGR